MEQLRQLGFRGKRPEDVVTSAVRFSRDVGSSLATGKEALAPTQAAVGRLNQLRPVLDELAMRQPVSGYFGGWLVNLGVIRPGEEIKNRDAMQRLGSAFTDVQAKLIGAGLTTGETAEGGFAPIFDNRRLRKLRAAKTADARDLLNAVERARGLALAMRHGFKEARVGIGLMQRKEQLHPRPRRRVVR